MPKYIWAVICKTHPEMSIRLETKTEAKNYFKWHLKTCFDVEPPRLEEAPFIG